MRYKNKIIFDNRFVIFVGAHFAQIGLIYYGIKQLASSKHLEIKINTEF